MKIKSVQLVSKQRVLLDWDGGDMIWKCSKVWGIEGANIMEYFISNVKSKDI